MSQLTDTTNINYYSVIGYCPSGWCDEYNYATLKDARAKFDSVVKKNLENEIYLSIHLDPYEACEFRGHKVLPELDHWAVPSERSGGLW